MSLHRFRVWHSLFQGLSFRGEERSLVFPTGPCEFLLPSEVERKPWTEPPPASRVVRIGTANIIDALTAFHAEFESRGTAVVYLFAEASEECWYNLAYKLSSMEKLDCDNLNDLIDDIDERAVSFMAQVVADYIHYTCDVTRSPPISMIGSNISLAAVSKLHRIVVLRLRGESAVHALGALEEVLARSRSDTQWMKNSTEATRGSFRDLFISLGVRTSIIPSSLSIQGLHVHPRAPFGGTYSDVYLGEYRGRPVALKTLRISIPSSDDILQEFCREALLWSSLRNDYVLAFLGIDRDSFSPRLAMVSPWLENGSLTHCVADLTNREIAVPCRVWLYEVALGMEYLHLEGIIHGDLRGANVLIDDWGHVKIADLGLSFLRNDSSTDSSAHSGGCTRSAAPELAQISSSPTFASDVFAYAFLAIEIYTGQVPFPQHTDVRVSTLVQRGKRPPRPPSMLEEHIWELIQQSWSPEPTNRPSFTDVVSQTYTCTSISPMTFPSQPTRSAPPSDELKASPWYHRLLSLLRP